MSASFNAAVRHRRPREGPPTRRWASRSWSRRSARSVRHNSRAFDATIQHGTARVCPFPSGPSGGVPRSAPSVLTGPNARRTGRSRPVTSMDGGRQPRRLSWGSPLVDSTYTSVRRLPSGARYYSGAQTRVRRFSVRLRHYSWLLVESNSIIPVSIRWNRSATPGYSDHRLWDRYYFGLGFRKPTLYPLSYGG